MVGIYELIVLVVGVIAFLLLFNYLIKKFVKNDKVKKALIVIVDTILILFLLLVLIRGFMSGLLDLSFGKKDQKEWIYNTLPQKLWEEQSTEIANTEYQRLVHVMEDYANTAIRRYDQAGAESDLDEYRSMALFGLDELYWLGGGSSSNEKKRAAQINKYKNQYEQVTDNLLDNMKTLLRLRDSSLYARLSYSDEQICKTLLGTPGSIASPSTEVQMNIARSIMTNLYYRRQRPSVSSCSYDRKEKAWNVRMDGAPNQVVVFYKRDDGNFDIEWTGNKGFVPEYTSSYASYDDSYDEEEERDFGGYAASSEFVQMNGYLLADNGKKIGIDIELTILGVGDDAEGFPTSGSYHYSSQSQDKRIGLDGSEYPGQRGLSQIVLYSEEGTERFDLTFDRDNNTLEGFWYQYEDEISCHTPDAKYKKKYGVSLECQ